MATSDVFGKKNKDQAKVAYAIIGGGINFSFSSGIYDPKDAEFMAIDRARALHCHLYSKDENGIIYQIYPERKKIEGGSKRIDFRAYPEMMSNDPFVPGIQVGTF
jgi:hypothetical protein